jgi:hypothetical protein
MRTKRSMNFLQLQDGWFVTQQEFLTDKEHPLSYLPTDYNRGGSGRLLIYRGLHVIFD